MYRDKINRIALITGITGQDGSYLTEFLLDHKVYKYEVHGVIRRSSSFNTGRIDHVYNNKALKLHYGDLTDSTNICSLINLIKPDEIYNLAAQSHVKVSFEMPEYTANVDGMGTLRILDAIRSCGLEKTCRFYQASTSELYGGIYTEAQDEKTPFYPRSPYAVAKLFSYWAVVNYREAYNMFACNGILFNHESPRRGGTFVTKKVTAHVAKVAKGSAEPLYLGNINALRDWGHARDYVAGMWLMLQQDKPDDFVLATGEQYSVRTFVEKAFAYVGIKISWTGEGQDEIGVDQNGVIRVRIDPKYYRPSEVETLLGNPKKAETILGWKRTVSMDQLIAEMMQFDLANN